MDDIYFDEIKPSDNQIVILYELLLKRKYNISHQCIPTFEMHTLFVLSHPYRYWFLIYLNAEVIGSFYISNDNTIGFNVDEFDNPKVLSKVLEFVKEHYAPLPAIKSVRNEVFAINVPPNNKLLIESLNNLGAKVLQITYLID